MKDFKKKTQLFPFRFPGIPCDIFGCYTRAKWVIGRPDGPLTECFKLCPNCVESILNHVPEEFKNDEAAEQGEPMQEITNLVQTEPHNEAEPPLITEQKLSNMTVKRLKEMASHHSIPGYSTMTKKELIASILTKVNNKVGQTDAEKV